MIDPAVTCWAPPTLLPHYKDAGENLGHLSVLSDSAAALVYDGVVVASAQEDRFTRKKHDPVSLGTRLTTASSIRGIPRRYEYMPFYDKPY